MQITLRPYQLEAIEKIQHEIFEKGVKSTLLIASTGCLGGDTVININRAGAGRKVTIRDLYNRTHGLDFSGENYDKSIPTYVRSYNGLSIQLHKIKDVMLTGIKKTWRLSTNQNNHIRVTECHKILTERGWVPAGELIPNVDRIAMDKNKPMKMVATNIKHRDSYYDGIKYHPYATKCGTDKRIVYHRAIYEAESNNLSINEYLTIIRQDEDRAKQLKFINPKIHHVHHIDHNHKNNDPKNLTLLTVADHLSHHGDHKNFNQGIVAWVLFTGLDYPGTEAVYDIECEDPYHNFVAGGLVVHNSGKTAILLHLAKTFHEATGKHVLIVTHRVAVILQSTQRYADYYKLRCGVYGDGNTPNGDEDIIMATIQTVHKQSALTKLGKIFANSIFGRDLNIGLIIVDESHMLGTATYDKFFKMLPNIPYVGFSATQFRENKLSTNLFESVAYQIPMKDLIRDGHLVPPKLMQFFPSGTEHADLLSMCVALYQERESGNSVVIFLRTKEMCEQLKNVFYGANLKAHVITDDTSNETRKKYFDDFEAKKVHILISVDVLSEGVDLPCVQAIMMPFKVGSVSRFIQRIGRGLRPYPGKTECRVYMAGIPPKLKGELYEHTGVQMMSLGKRKADSDPFDESMVAEVQVEVEYSIDANVKRILKKAEVLTPGIAAMIQSTSFPLEFMGTFKEMLGKIKQKDILKLPATPLQVQILSNRGIEIPKFITNYEARLLIALTATKG